MLRYTSPLLSNCIKVGKNLPKGAIELAKFSLNKDVNLESNKNSNSDLDIDINYSYGKEVSLFRSLNDLIEKDDNLFEQTIPYESITYNGTLAKVNVSYKEYKKDFFTRESTVQKEYVLSSDMEIPSSVVVRDAEEFGELYASSISIKTKQKINKTIAYDYYFPVFVASIKGQTLSSNNSYDYVLFQSSTICCEKTESTETILSVWSRSLQNGTFQSEIIHNSYSYLFTGEKRSKTEETWVKHYGTCRYWGGGGSSSNNYYGDPDYRFRVNGWTAKGYMNDKYATPTLWRYGRVKNVICRHRPEKYPIDVGGFWTTNVGEKAGIAWTYDIEEAAKYGGSTDKARGGVVWASAFAGKQWPPKGYETDHSGSSFYPIVSGNNGTINPTGKIITKNGAQKTSTAGFYNSGGWYCKWFRDVILFYKGKTVKSYQEGRYETIIINHKAPILIASEIIGAIKRERYDLTIEDGLESLSVLVSYTGRMYKEEKRYSAIAKYTGKVYKNYKLKQADHQTYSDSLAFVNNNGLIEAIGSGINLLSPYIELTDYEIDGEPLYYTYKCKNNIRINSTKDKIITTNNLALIKNASNLKYIYIAEKINDDMYSLSILLNKPVCYSDNILIEFINSNESVKETICTALLYNQGVDYSIKYIDGEYRCEFGDASIEEDTREKVDVSFKIKTKNGLESNIYSARIVSKENAIAGERLKFKQNMMMIDILDEKSNIMTAKEILKKDTESEVNDDDLFFIEIVSSSSICDPYVDSSGNSPVYIEAHQYIKEKENTFKVKVSVDGFIRNGFIIKEISNIPFATLFKSNGHEPKFISVKSGSFCANGVVGENSLKAEYIIPDTNSYCDLGVPFVKKKEYLQVREKEVIPSCKMLCSNDKIKITSNGSPIEIDKISQKNNKIKIKSSAKNVVIEYYEIKTYTDYKGIVSGGKTYVLDLNLGPFHEYYNWVSGSYESSSTLNGKVIYMFLKPSLVSVIETGEVIKRNDIETSIYHKIDSSYPDDPLDSLLAVIYINDISKDNIVISDSRTIGGGLKDKYLLKYSGRLNSIFDNNDDDYIPIRNSGVIVTSVNPSIITKNEIEIAASEFVPVGTLNIVKSIK